MSGCVYFSLMFSSNFSDTFALVCACASSILPSHLHLSEWATDGRETSVEMGGNLSKALSGLQKKTVEQPPDAPLEDPPTPPAPDPRLPLTARQLFNISKSWKGIARAMEPTGITMFVRWEIRFIGPNNKDIEKCIVTIFVWWEIRFYWS